MEQVQDELSVDAAVAVATTSPAECCNTTSIIAASTTNLTKDLSHSSSATSVVVTEFDKNYTVSNSNNTVINLANAQSLVLFATDEWFAAADHLVRDEPPAYNPTLYSHKGKVMDGWESRRRRLAGHDWALLQLGTRGIPTTIQADTSYFTGNHAPAISLDFADLSQREAADLVRNLPRAVERLLVRLQARNDSDGSSTTTDGDVEPTTLSSSCTEEQVATAHALTAHWQPLLPKTKLRPNELHTFVVNCEKSMTHVRVNYFPDGGVARLRVFGTPTPLPASTTYTLSDMPIVYYDETAKCTVVPHSCGDKMPSQQPFAYAELSSQDCGGIGLDCSNEHYGSPSQLLQSGLGINMGDGWETARQLHRPSVILQNPTTGLVEGNLHDWCILLLGKPAVKRIARILVDTKHFRGNYPESVEIFGCYKQVNNSTTTFDHVDWFQLVPRCRVTADAEHVFDDIHTSGRHVSHIKVCTYPDGGLSRVRVYGE